MSDNAQRLVVGWLWVATILALILASAVRSVPPGERAQNNVDAQGVDFLDLLPIM